MEKGDPTRDEMLCFVKPSAGTLEPPPPPLALHAHAPPPPPSVVPPQLSLFLDSGPPSLLDFLKLAQKTLSEGLPQLEAFVLKRLEGVAVASTATPGEHGGAEAAISGGSATKKVAVASSSPITAMLTPERVRSFFEPLKVQPPQGRAAARLDGLPMQPP